VCVVRSDGKGGGERSGRVSIVNEGEWGGKGEYVEPKSKQARHGEIWVRIPSVRRGGVRHVLLEEAKEDHRHPTTLPSRMVG